MKVSILYTVLSVLNLIAFAIVVSLLPASVPVHFNGAGVVDRLGSAWEYIAFPSITALLSIGVFIIMLRMKSANRKYFAIALALVGGLFLCMGWAFLGLAAQGAEYGEKVGFPFAAVSALPISLLLIAFGAMMPRLEANYFLGIRTSATLKSERVWEKTHRVGGIAFIVCGAISAITAVVFSCLDVSPRLDWLALVVLLVALVVTALFCVIYSYTVKEEAPTQE